MIYLLIALPTLVPVAMWIAVFSGFDPWLAGDIAGVAIFVGFVGMLVTAKDALVARWCWLSTGAHLGWEMPFVLLSRHLVGVSEHDKWAFLFWTYGTADTRYINADPGIVGIESLTSFIVAPLIIYVIVLLGKGEQQKAHLWLVIASACQLYGAVLYFLEEALRGFTGFSAEPIDLWVKVVGLNGIWLVMPVILFAKLLPGLLAPKKA